MAKFTLMIGTRALTCLRFNLRYLCGFRIKHYLNTSSQTDQKAREVVLTTLNTLNLEVLEEHSSYHLDN